MSEFTINATSKSASGMAVKYLPTGDAYDAWASVYDTDGNMLVAVDNIELEALLPDFLENSLSNCEGNASVTIADVGCGTGRNTLAIMQHLVSREQAAAWVEVLGIDLSEGMLAIAQEKLDKWQTESRAPGVTLPAYSLQRRDLFALDAVADHEKESLDAIVSTLVLEHIPVETYFRTLSSLLKSGGSALVTNMHSDMGSKAQAGFAMKDDNSGEVIKVRGTSFAHTNQDVINAAQKAGLEATSIMERAVTDGLSEQLGARSRKWIGGNVWSGFVLRKNA